jgi:hypothetical protein
MFEEAKGEVAEAQRELASVKRELGEAQADVKEAQGKLWGLHGKLWGAMKQPSASWSESSGLQPGPMERIYPSGARCSCLWMPSPGFDECDSLPVQQMAGMTRSPRAWLLLALAAGCGSEPANSSQNNNGGPPPGDGGPGTADAGPGDDASPATGDSAAEAPMAFRDRLAGWSGGYLGGFYPAQGYAISGKRLVSIPDALSATLGAVTVVDASGPKPTVLTLPVTGRFPAGTVEAFTYEPSVDRLVLVIRAVQTSQIEIVTIAFSASEATFKTLTQTGAPNTTSLIGPLYPTRTGGTLVAVLGSEAATLTLSDSAAVWGTPVSASLVGSSYVIPMPDPAHGRLLTFGKMTFDAATHTTTFDPSVVQTMALTPPFTWTDLPSGGEAPPSSTGVANSSRGVYDATGNKLLAVTLHTVDCGPGQPPPCLANGLWSFDLSTDTWTKLQDIFSGDLALEPPFLVDQGARRMVMPLDGTLIATSLDTQQNPTLAGAPLDQQGDLGPVFPTAATVLSGGRILSTDHGVFRVLDPSVATPHWERFGTSLLPSELTNGGISIATDAKTGETLVSGADPSSAFVLYLLSADGKTITRQNGAGGPAGRLNHGSIVLEGKLYVVGGMTGSTTFDDVWTFDRASSQWAQVAKLPVTITNVTLGTSTKGELLALGDIPGAASSSGYSNSQVFALDTSSYGVRSLAVPGTSVPLWSVAGYRGCFLGFEAGSTVGAARPNLWRCTFENGSVRWTSTPLDEHGFALYGLRSASSVDALHAYFVGRHLWEAFGK